MKRIFKILGVLFVLLLVVVGGVAYYFQANIIPILKSEINKSLAVEVKLDEITISGIRDFPNLGIKLTNVSINESTPYYKEKLLKAEELNLFVDVLKLYKGEYVIDAVVLRNGVLRVADLSKKTNYDITKPSTEGNSSAVSFEVKSLKLIDCDIIYEHTPSAFRCESYTPFSNIRLKYVAEATDLSINTTLDHTVLEMGKENYINDKNLNIITDIKVKTKERLIEIASSSILVEEVKLKTEGTVSYGNKSNIAIEFSNDNTAAQSLLSVLPKSISALMDNVRLDGDVVINGSIVGETGGGNNPALALDYAISDASVSIKGESLSLSNVQANGKLTMPNISKNTSAKVICNLENAKSNKNSLSGKIEVKNFDRPSITWDGKAVLDAAFLLALVGDSDFDVTAGNVMVDGKLQLAYSVKTKKIVPNSLKYTGEVLVNKLAGTLTNPKLNIKNIDLKISANNSKMVVNRASFAYNETTGVLKGYIDNFSSLFNEKSSATLVGELSVQNLNVNELYSVSPVVESSVAASEKGKNLLPIKLKLKTELTNFRYNDFIAESMIGNLLADKNQIGMAKCKVVALQGNTFAAITLKKWGDNFLLDVNSDVKNVSITQLFKQFNNFEQTEITDKHLSGTLSGTILAKVILDKNFRPVLPKLYAKADVVVENGALVNYAPLKELSSFVRISDLENVKFKTLKNTIEIFDQTIFIPKMRIENNALNLEIEGSHTFENYMKYRMNLSVAQLLATKANWIAKKKNSQIKKNSTGGLTAYILMEGTPDNLKISYDKETVKENVQDEIKKEKKKFIEALKGKGSLEDESVDAKDYDNVWDE